MNGLFLIMEGGLSNVFGMFTDGTASFSFDQQTQTISNVKLALNAFSLSVPNQNISQSIRMLFNVADYPEISFIAASPTTFKDGKAEIKGTMKFHGQTKPAVFEATLNHAGANKADEDEMTVGISLKGIVKRSEFGMGDEPEMPGRFGDEVTFMIELKGIEP